MSAHILWSQGCPESLRPGYPPWAMMLFGD
jgi:hypothetical protein